MSVNQNSRPNLKRPRRVQDLLLARKSARITAPPLFILGELPTDVRYKRHELMLTLVCFFITGAVVVLGKPE